MGTCNRPSSGSFFIKIVPSVGRNIKLASFANRNLLAFYAEICQDRSLFDRFRNIPILTKTIPPKMATIVLDPKRLEGYGKIGSDSRKNLIEQVEKLWHEINEAIQYGGPIKSFQMEMPDDLMKIVARTYLASLSMSSRMGTTSGKARVLTNELLVTLEALHCMLTGDKDSKVLSDAAVRVTSQDTDCIEFVVSSKGIGTKGVSADFSKRLGTAILGDLGSVAPKGPIPLAQSQGIG